METIKVKYVIEHLTSTGEWTQASTNSATDDNLSFALRLLAAYKAKSPEQHRLVKQTIFTTTEVLDD